MPKTTTSPAMTSVTLQPAGQRIVMLVRQDTVRTIFPPEGALVNSPPIIKCLQHSIASIVTGLASLTVVAQKPILAALQEVINKFALKKKRPKGRFFIT